MLLIRGAAGEKELRRAIDPLNGAADRNTKYFRIGQLHLKQIKVYQKEQVI